MSSLKWTVPGGLVAIAATWFFFNPPNNSSQESAQEDTYQQQLAALRKKQEAAKAAKLAKDKSTPPVETSQIASSSGSLPRSTAQSKESVGSVPPSPSAPLANSAPWESPSNQVSKHIQNTMQSLQNMMPSASRPPVANFDSNAQRLQYLQTMPLGIIESTKKQDASFMARQDAGRVDPFGELPAFKPFPKQKAIAEAQVKADKKKKQSDFLNGPEGLPPPPTSASLPDLAPPPPPPGITTDELWDQMQPPDKPMLSEHLKLNAILGDQVILAFKDRRFQKKNHFQQYITLSQGQVFDTVTLIDIGKDQAVINEHGRQITMQLDPIR